MRRLTGSKIANTIILIAVICVPLLYCGLLTWAYEDPLNRLDRLDAAVVNLDQPATATTPAGKEKQLHVGADLAERLTHPKDENVGFKWQSADAETAKAGMANGKYRAVLTIPADFSKNLSQLASKNAEDVKPSQLQMDTDDGINYLAGTMAANVARELENLASADGSEKYIDNVLVSVSSIHDGMEKATEGASKLNDGSKKLHDGASQLADGSNRLADGTGKLANGAQRLAGGNQQLASGTTRLVTGLRALATGAVTLNNANGQIATGAQRLNEGAQKLNAGVQKAQAGSQALASGINQYTDGVSRLQTGAAALLGGMTQPSDDHTPSYVDGFNQLTQALQPGNDPKNPTLRDATKQLAAGAEKYGAGLEKASQASQKLAAGAAQVSSGVKNLETQLKPSDPTVAGSGTPEPTLADGVTMLAEGAKALSGGSEQLDGGIDSLAKQFQPGEVDGKPTLRSGLEALHAGAAELNGKSPELLAGIQKLTGQFKDSTDPENPTLKSGLEQVDAGLAKLAEKSAPLAETKSISGKLILLKMGTHALSSGAKSAKTGANNLDSSLETISAGTQKNNQIVASLAKLCAAQPNDAVCAQLNAGLAKQGVKGINDWAERADALAKGTSAAKNGAHKLAQSSSDISSLVQQLVDGIEKAEPKLQKLAKAAVIPEKLDQLHQGTSTILEKMGESSSDINALTEGANALENATTRLSAGSKDLLDGVTEKAPKLQVLSAGAKRLTEGAQRLSAGTQELNQKLAKKIPLIEELSQGAQRLAAGTEGLEAGFEDNTTGTNEDTLMSGYRKLNNGLQRLESGMTTAGDAAQSLNQGLTQRIIPGVRRLAGGAARLARNSHKLTEGAAQLSAGSEKLAAGTQLLSEKAPLLAEGAKKAAAGTERLYGGLVTARDGGEKLQSGAQQASNGANTLADKLQTAKSGANRLADGAKKLQGGTEKLQDGSSELHEKLAEGADKIPAFSDSAASAIAQTAGHPIEVNSTRIHPASHNGIGFAPFFMALALYVGAIAMFFIFPALDVRRFRDEKWWLTATRTFTTTGLLGLAQAVAAVLGLQLLLHLNAQNLGSLFGVMILASICFVSINQACVAALGFRGRFVSVVLLILQISSMGATFPIETAPWFLRTISPILPMTHLAASIRTNIVGGGLSLGHGIVVILIWTLLAWAVTLVAAKARTAQKPLPFDPALAFPGTEAASATSKMSVALP